MVEHNHDDVPSSEQRGLTLACSMGDLEISWDPSNDHKVRDMIQAKMDQGYRFFVMKPLLGDLLAIRRRVFSATDLKSNSVKIRDNDIAAMFSAGEVSLFRTNEQESTGVALKTADEVVRNRTIGVPQFRGG